jgi:cell division septation protein DedD
MTEGQDLFVLLEVSHGGQVLVLGAFTSEEDAERRCATLRSGKSNAQVHVATFEG